MDAVILTPIATGTVLPPVDLGFPRVYSECAPVDMAREINININRDRLQGIYRSRLYRKYKYVYLIDSDVVVTHDDLVKLSEAWKPGTTPCILTKESDKGHTVCSCCFMTGADYLRVDYMSRPRECQCYKLPNPYYVDGLKGKEVKL